MWDNILNKSWQLSFWEKKERRKVKKNVFSVGQYKTTSKFSAIRLFIKQQTDKQVMTGGTVQVNMLN